MLQGETVDCVNKGRRLNEAYDHGMETLDGGLSEAAEWEQGRWGVGVNALIDGYSTVALVHLEGKIKLDDLRKVPRLWQARMTRCEETRRCEPRDYATVAFSPASRSSPVDENNH